MVRINDTPPKRGFFVIEVDVDRDRDNPLFASIRGPFSTFEKAEQERDEQQAAWERALEEWDDGNPYDFKGWDIVEKHLSDYQIEQLSRQDEESYQVMKDAADATMAGILAEDGIGPMADESE